ncbi:MAG: transglycosylase SLT domain-containing protein [Deltaproteobacteria bacterium]|nr:transglycosylase SLT domain-containing protein [Deltaproteobacteria bacterium]
MADLTRLVVVVCVCGAIAACSGDDSHHKSTLPKAPDGSGSQVAATPDAGDVGSAAPTTPAQLSESMANPYFDTGDAAEGMRAFQLEQWKDAQAAFAKARPALTGQDGARLDLMIGLVHARLDQWPAAAKAFVAAAKPLPLLADYINYQAARALYFAKDMAKATEHAQAVPRDSIHGADAELLVGDILRSSGDHAKVAAFYKDYLSRRASGPRKSEVRYRIGESLEGAGSTDWKDLVGFYRAIRVDDPLSSWAKRAEDRLKALVPRLPDDLKNYDAMTATEHVTRGRVLFDAQRNPESESAFDLALADKSITADEKCVAAYHRAQSRFKARDRRSAAPMFDAAALACKVANNTDLHVKSMYQAGRSYAWYDHETATKRYQAAQIIDTTHSYSDDAMLREAEEWASLNDAKQVEAVLSAIPTKFPKGDQLAESMWRLGFKAWQAKQYDAAIKWWTKQMELVPRDDNYFGEGQAQYWLGRAQAAKGKKREAIAAWQQCVRTYPAAYYSLLSLNRLRETDAKQYEAMVAEISTDPKDFDPKAPAFTFKPRVEYATSGFQRALEFLRLGLGDSAEAELRKLGLTAPKDKKRVEDADKVEKLWAMAFLFDKARRYESAHWPTRWHMLDYRTQWPIGTNRARWLIGYPLAYQELLARHAKLNDVPFAMQIAIVREESAFDPLLESTANAVGLTQMIQVTAKDFSKGTGIDPTRENLRDPEKNVTIGSKFLGYLYKRFDRFTTLIPPGYNGGPAYTSRVLKMRGTLDADEFIEAIQADEARNYTKRVVGTYFTYSWLYEKKIPEMPLAIPKSVIPK